ncbi:hypothetical protein DRQ36_10595 [bacterium]|nr:MAG: hypothetical protein DRQ36_10595 [bacterium]
MKKLTVISIIVLGFALALFAEDVGEEPAETGGPQPKIVLGEQRFDFGYSPEGFFMVHAYKVKNEGEAELRIQRVRTTCGCTSAPMKKMQLAPGEDTEVTVIFNSTRYRHSTSKSAIITSNDPVNRSVRVTFTANMDTTGFPFVVEPWGMEIPTGEDPPKEMIFKVKNSSESKVNLNVVDYTADVFNEPKLKNDKLKPGQDTKIELTLNEDFDPAAHYIKASVTIEAEGIGEKPVRFTLPVKGSGPR